MPRTCSEGGASHTLSVSIPVLCFLPEDAQAFPGDVAPSSLHLQPSTAETTFPGRCQPSGPSVPFTLCSDLEQVEKKLLQSMGCVLPVPGPGPNLSQCCFQYFIENQIQLVLLDLSFPWRLKVVSLLPCLCSERTLKHLQPEQTQQAQAWQRKNTPFARPSC